MNRIKETCLKVCYFLHITDGQGQLDVVDLSFIAVVLKLLLAPGIDFGAVCALIPLIMNQMHVRHVESKHTSAE